MLSEDTVKLLNNLIQTSEDGKKGFAEAAEVATRRELKTMFRMRSRDWATAAIELRALVQSIGGTPKDSGTIAEVGHRGWAKLKTAVGDANIGMLEEVERTEDKAKAAYVKTLTTKLPQQIRVVVQRQHDGAVRNHNRIRDLRNSYSATTEAVTN